MIFSSVRGGDVVVGQGIASAVPGGIREGEFLIKLK